MHIRYDKLDKTQDALMMAQRALAPTATPDQRADALAAVLVAQSFIVAAKDQRATPAEIEEARDQYGDDENEIDDDAGTSRAEDGSGLWVQAWVWLARDPDEDSDLVEAAEGDPCAACERPSVDCSRAPCPDVIADREA